MAEVFRTIITHSVKAKDLLRGHQTWSVTHTLEHEAAVILAKEVNKKKRNSFKPFFFFL